jgi:Plasmid pRiA4b ORF-3-like protein
MPAAVALHVELDELPEPVWRKLTVPAAASLQDLARALLIAFDWDGYHLWAFWPDEAWHGRSYMDPKQMDGEEDDAVPASTIATADVLAAVGDELLWIYDFGDAWEHVIRVEAVVDDPADRIICADGLNASPPEDCGGPSGFANLLEALADPQHDEHDALLEWLGAPFDPHAFDRDALNRRLRRMVLRGVQTGR